MYYHSFIYAMKSVHKKRPNTNEFDVQYCEQKRYMQLKVPKCCHSNQGWREYSHIILEKY